MSTKPALQTAEDLLEEPEQLDKPRGLVARGSILFVLVGIILLLALFAYFDLTKKPEIPKVGSALGRESSASQIAAVGPAPQPNDVRSIAETQAAKAPVIEPTTPIPGLSSPAVGGAPRAPGDANLTPRVRSPLDLNSSSDHTVGRTEAHLERDAAAAESGIFASGVGGGDAITGAVAGAAAAFTDPLARQIEDVKQSLIRTSTTAADPTAEIIRAMTAAQGGKSSLQQGKDEAWLTGQSTTTTAPAVYAQTPASPFMIFQGTRVPLVTREAINSDLPGQVTAMSTSNVYDSINQCAVMIPAGTKFIGAYSSDIRPGQARLLLSYRRMIFPDGKSVDLDGAQGVDQTGSAGAEAGVNNHFLQMFGYGFAMAIVGDRLGGSTNVSTRSPDGSTSTTTLVGQVIGDIANRVMSRNSVIAPTLTLPHGTPMFVTIVRDIALTPTSRKYCK